jgi:uncharacterized repeat protein (TIGR03803 family)
LHSFCAKNNCGDGSFPRASLVMDEGGNLFGNTDTGGNGRGVVFELRQTEPGKFKFIKLYTFCRRSMCNDGYNPMGALIVDTNGNLYGTASLGGAGRKGVVFKLSPTDKGKWTQSVLYSFCHDFSCSDGSTPAAGLTYAGAASGAPYDGVSPLYGTTAAGGANSEGTVFSLVLNGSQWTEAILYNFCSQGGSACSDGAGPLASLAMDQAGNLYGTTGHGGHQEGGGAGVAYELLPNGNGSWTETVLHLFCSAAQCADGEFPDGNLIWDSGGSLLGTTAAGGLSCDRGPFGCGTIFKLVPNGTDSQESVLYAFCQKKDCKDGANPVGAVVLDSGGNLFGTTTDGGGNDIDGMSIGGGVVYELSGSTFSVLHRFCSKSDCADGADPEAGLVIDGSGNLFGTATMAGAFAAGGDVFEVHP